MDCHKYKITHETLSNFNDTQVIPCKVGEIKLYIGITLWKFKKPA